MVRYRWHFAGLIISLLLMGCSGDSPYLTPGDDILHPVNLIDVVDVIVTDTPPGELVGNAVEVTRAWVSGNALTLTVKYSGGCFDHEFSCYMTPAAFMESHPVQANLYVLDNTSNDPCDAIVSGPAVFDLSTVADLYIEQYSRVNGMALNVYDFTDEEPVKKFTVIYIPDL